jgi:hypothetical protein
MTFHRLFLAVSAATLAVGALSGCAVMDAVATKEHERVFATHNEAAADDVVLPSFMPEDSTSIRMRTSTEGDGTAELVRFTTAESLPLPECEPGALEGLPPFDTTWWPATVPETGSICTGWQVFEHNGATYAWVSA